jgi:hypothetical protein
MTRGHRGSLLLRCRALSSLSPCRFIPALEFFAGSLLEEEEHADWLETELSLNGQVGEGNYLTQQIHD